MAAPIRNQKQVLRNPRYDNKKKNSVSFLENENSAKFL